MPKKEELLGVIKKAPQGLIVLTQQYHFLNFSIIPRADLAVIYSAGCNNIVYINWRFR
jgi:hypothetical protein